MSLDRLSQLFLDLDRSELANLPNLLIDNGMDAQDLQASGFVQGVGRSETE
ncbi:hypothetical protein PYCC9005_003026 [Savitreella phatthalungensis]